MIVLVQVLPEQTNAGSHLVWFRFGYFLPGWHLQKLRIFC